MNQTKVTEFILLGFGNLHHFNSFFFILFLIIFLLTVLGNLLIIVLVSTNMQLQSPMYYFLCHLSFSDLVISMNIVPNMLGAMLLGGKIITYLDCIAQFYFFSGTTIAECLLLSVMSYDRYLAICNPLRYSSVMDFKRQIYLSLWPWLLGLTLNLTTVLPISNFNFCHDNIIDHFFCDLLPLQKLSCSDTSLVELEVISVFCALIYPSLWLNHCNLCAHLPHHTEDTVYNRQTENLFYLQFSSYSCGNILWDY
ncbi:Olfactory receptor [Pristimantis euphronides]